MNSSWWCHFRGEERSPPRANFGLVLNFSHFGLFVTGYTCFLHSVWAYRSKIKRAFVLGSPGNLQIKKLRADQSWWQNKEEYNYSVHKSRCLKITPWLHYSDGFCVFQCWKHLWVYLYFCSYMFCYFKPLWIYIQKQKSTSWHTKLSYWYWPIIMQQVFFWTQMFE